MQGEQETHSFHLWPYPTLIPSPRKLSADQCQDDLERRPPIFIYLVMHDLSLENLFVFILSVNTLQRSLMGFASWPIDRFTDTAAIFISIVTINYYGMLRSGGKYKSY